MLLTLFSSATTNGVTDFLTLPWYHQFARINVNVAFFVPFFAAVTLAYGVLLIARLTRRSWTILPTTLAMVAVLAIFTGVHAARVAGDFVHTSFSPGTRFSPVLESQAAVDSDSLAAFAWLRAHVAKDDTVANEPFVDGSLWMYAQSHVAPLVGMYEGLATKLPPDLADRVYLSRSVQRLGQDRRATLLARRYRTRWIYHDERSFGVFSRAAIRRVPLAELMQNPNLGLVFHQGSAFVFEVNLAS